MKSRTNVSLTAILFFLLIAFCLHCTQGYEPETVIVPVGEPGDSDPFKNTGFACGESGAPITSQIVGEDETGEEMFLMTFTGTSEVWFVLVTASEYQAVEDRLTSIWEIFEVQTIGTDKVDGLQQDLCRPFDRRSDQGEQLFEILYEALGPRMDDLALGLCE